MSVRMIFLFGLLVSFLTIQLACCEDIPGLPRVPDCAVSARCIDHTRFKQTLTDPSESVSPRGHQIQHAGLIYDVSVPMKSSQSRLTHV